MLANAVKHSKKSNQKNQDLKRSEKKSCVRINWDKNADVVLKQVRV